MVNKKLSIIVFLLLLLLNLPVQGQKYKCPTGKSFPIVAWYSIEENHISNENYRVLEQAGFNISLSYYSTQTNAKRALVAAEGTNVKLIVSCSDSLWRSGVAEKEIYKHPNFGLFYISDEPSIYDYPRIKRQIDSFKEYDKRHLPYVNLLPIYAKPAYLNGITYLEYLQGYIDTFSPSYISYDHYPFYRDVFKSDFFENLEIVSRLTQKYSIPFWGFVSSVTNSNNYMSNEAKIRFQVFCNIAYGAQGIQYFTYTCPKGNVSAILDSNYSKTSIYEIVAGVNDEIRQISKYVLNSKGHKVWHTGDIIPQGCTGIINDKRIESIESDGIGLVCSLFKRKNKDYLLIVNRDYEHFQTADLKFSRKTKQITKEGFSKKSNAFVCSISPGDYRLFML